MSTGGKHDPLPPTLGYVNNTTMNKLLKRIKMFFCPHKWVPVEYQEREFYNKFARQINFKYRGTRL